MNHNAGWQETATDLFIENQSDIKSLKDVLQEIEPEQVHEPGTVVSYSNWGAALAGYIVECISGQSFDVYVHEHIFQPLGMDHTALNADLSDNNWVMDKRAEEKCYMVDRTSLGINHYYLPMYPAGGAIGTLGDFIKFAKAFLPAEGEISPLFQQPETLEEMLSPSMYFADGVTPRNCHGFWTDQFGVPVIFHDGGTLGSTSLFAIDLKSGTGIVILTNQYHEYIYTCGLPTKIFGELKYTIDTNQKEDISGMYVTSRSCFQGYTKLFSLMSMLQLVSDNQGGYTVPGSPTKFISIGGHSYIMDMDGKQFLVQTSRLEDDTPVIQFIGMDYIQINGYGVIAELILLLLFAVVTLISVVNLVIHMIQAIRHICKPFLGARITVDIAIILSFAMFAYIALRLLGGVALYRQVHWAIVVVAACGLVPMAYIILLALNWRKLLCSKKHKVGLILTGFGGLIMTINVIYWNAYMFW
jgi:CubicO group peptidase (beta-lactamase class C family)